MRFTPVKPLTDRKQNNLNSKTQNNCPSLHVLVQYSTADPKHSSGLFFPPTVPTHALIVKLVCLFRLSQIATWEQTEMKAEGSERCSCRGREGEQQIFLSQFVSVCQPWS